MFWRKNLLRLLLCQHVSGLTSFLRVSRRGFNQRALTRAADGTIWHMFSMENTLRSVRSLMACNFFLNIFFFLTTITSSNHYMPNVISCGLWTVIMYRCMNYLKFGFKDHEKGAEQNYTILKTHYWRPLLKLISQVQQKSEGTLKNAFKNTKRHSSNMWIWLWSWLSN